MACCCTVFLAQINPAWNSPRVLLNRASYSLNAFVDFAPIAQAQSAIASIKRHMALFEGMNRVDIEQRSVSHGHGHAYGHLHHSYGQNNKENQKQSLGDAAKQQQAAQSKGAAAGGQSSLSDR